MLTADQHSNLWIALTRKMLLWFSWLFFFSIVLGWTLRRCSFSPRTTKHIWWLFTKFITLETFQSTWHPFKLAAVKLNANRAGFRKAVSISSQSVCSHRCSLSWLIYFTSKGLSICIARTSWKKYIVLLNFFCFSAEILILHITLIHSKMMGDCFWIYTQTVSFLPSSSNAVLISFKPMDHEVVFPQFKCTEYFGHH